MIKIEHIALWVKDIEKMRQFYCLYFGGKSNEKYTNEKKGFSSYFISFDDGARLEIMHSIHLDNQPTQDGEPHFGLIHLAISVGSPAVVDQLTAQLNNDGYKVLSGPRTTGDGYYESCVLDPENNQIEITAN